MPFDDDDITTDSNTVTTKMVVTPDGCCARHPRVQLRGRDSSGRLYQRDSCYECDVEFETEQSNRLRKQKELDRQIQNLDDAGGGSTSIKLKHLDINNKDNNINSDDMSTATSNATGVTTNTAAYGAYPPYGGYPPPYAYQPHPYGYPPYGHQPPPPPPPQGPQGPHEGGPLSQPGHRPPPPPHAHHAWGAPPPPPQTVSAPAPDDSKLFQMLTQKEDELKELRTKYEESQAELQKQTVELSRLQAKFEQATATLEQERKIAKLEAEAAASERLEKMLESQRKEHRETMKQMQQQMSQAAAAIALASKEPPPPPILLQSHPSLVSKDARDEAQLDKDEAQVASNTYSTSSLQRGTGMPKNDRDYDSNISYSANSLHTEDNMKLPTSKFDKASKIPSQPVDLDADEEEDTDTFFSEVEPTQEISKEPKSMTSVDWPTGNNDTYEQVEEPSVPQTKSSKPWDRNYMDGTNSVVDDVSTGGNMSAAPQPTTNNNNVAYMKQDSGHSSKNSSKSSGEERDQFDAQDTTNRFTPKYSDPNEQLPIVDDDNRSIGQTVASSTYGEDRQKVVNKTLLDPYGDKGCYTGVVLRTTGMPHGLGRMLYEEDGRIYEGDWRHGRWHGYGRATFSNGDHYEGEYKFDQRHGKGVYSWNDGRIYDGQFSEDKRHGHGIFTWPDGAVFEGEFNNGQRQGHGKYTFADGGQYDGGWKDGRYSGFGTCTWEDGRRYRGEWRNGMAHGRGTETYPNGAIRHEGEWIDDEPVR